MQATYPQVSLGFSKRIEGDLYQRSIVRCVEFQLALFSLLVGFVVGYAPNFNVPTVRQKVSFVNWRERQGRFVGMLYAMFVQPVVNALFVGGSHQVPILASETLATIPAIGAQRNAVQLKKAHNHRACNAAIVLSDSVKRCARFIGRTNGGDGFRRVVFFKPSQGPLDTMLVQPVHNGRLVDTILDGNLSVGQAVSMDHASEFLAGGRLDTTLTKASSSRAGLNAVSLKPLQNQAIAYAKSLAYGLSGQLLVTVKRTQFAFRGNRQRFLNRQDWRNRVEGNPIAMNPLADSLRLDAKHLGYLRGAKAFVKMQAAERIGVWFAGVHILSIALTEVTCKYVELPNVVSYAGKANP